MLAVDYAEPPGQVRDFVAARDVRFRIGLDPNGAVAREYAVNAFPTSYVIGADGTILARFIGPVDIAAVEDSLPAWLGAAG